MGPKAAVILTRNGYDRAAIRPTRTMAEKHRFCIAWIWCVSIYRQKVRQKSRQKVIQKVRQKVSQKVRQKVSDLLICPGGWVGVLVTASFAKRSAKR